MDVVCPLNNTIVGDVQLHFDNQDSFAKQTIARLGSTVQQTLDEKESLNNIDTCPWRTIVNHAVEAVDHVDPSQGMVRFSTTWFFNMVLLCKRGTTHWLDCYRCFLDTYLGQMCYLLGLHTSNNRRLTFPATGERFLFTGDNCPDKTGYHDFVQSKASGTVFLVIETEYEPSQRWVAYRPHKGAHYPEKRKHCITQHRKMKMITIL